MTIAERLAQQLDEMEDVLLDLYKSKAYTDAVWMPGISRNVRTCSCTNASRAEKILVRAGRLFPVPGHNGHFVTEPCEPVDDAAKP